MMKSWWAVERTGNPFALVVKIFVGNITARTGSPNHRFCACSLGTSVDNSTNTNTDNFISIDLYLRQDKLFHDNRIIYTFYSTKATVLIRLDHHPGNFLTHVLERQTNTRWENNPWENISKKINPTAKYNVFRVLAAIRVKFVIFPFRIRMITRATLKYCAAASSSWSN